MTKTEIIQSIAYVGVPSGSCLVEHDVPELGLTSFGVHTGNDTGGLKIIAARMFADQLTADTESLPETPDDGLFIRLHRSASEFHRLIAETTFIDAVEEEVVDTHRKVIRRLREIALKLGIQYEEPYDPLMNPPEPPKIDGGE